MIKKLTYTILISLFAYNAYAGDILTNTNQSARFARLFALEGYTTGADIAYYNPAGTTKLPLGFSFSVANQSAFQERVIHSTFDAYKMNGGSNYKSFKGTASAPIIPSIQGVYRIKEWAISGSIAVVGGGGKATFDDGLSMFEVLMAQTMLGLNANPAAPAGITKYDYNTYMSGSNFIYGAQLGAAYEINSMFSVYGGFRLNIVHNSYNGYLNDVRANIGGGDKLHTLADLNPAYKEKLDLSLDSKQNGWGVAPIIGVNFNYKNLNIGAKYEFKTALNVENKTKASTALIDYLPYLKDGVNTAHDVPSLLAIGASYKIINPLTVSFSYHHFFDRKAKMSDVVVDEVLTPKQKFLKRGTNEYLAGIEYQVDQIFSVSMGGQLTRMGLADNFQSDLSFYCNSYSLGFGGAANVTPKVKINIGYFFTHYDKYTMNTPSPAPLTVYERKNKVFTAGVDFSF